MPKLQTTLASASAFSKPQSDRRQHKRIDLNLTGRFLNADSEDHPLSTLNISCSGAMIKAESKAAVDTQIVCYFDELGRVSAHIIRQTADGFAVRFNVTDHKRDKIADRLTWLLNKDRLELPDDRTTSRYDAGGPALIALQDGRQIQCRVVDISLAGASFETDGELPKMGEEVLAGNLRGTVVRVLQNCFAIRYIR